MAGTQPRHAEGARNGWIWQRFDAEHFDAAMCAHSIPEAAAQVVTKGLAIGIEVALRSQDEVASINPAAHIAVPRAEVTKLERHHFGGLGQFVEGNIRAADCHFE